MICRTFTRRFFQTHGLQTPFVLDPSGELTKKVLADREQGEKLGVKFTPPLLSARSMSGCM